MTGTWGSRKQRPVSRALPQPLQVAASAENPAPPSLGEPKFAPPRRRRFAAGGGVATTEEGGEGGCGNSATPAPWTTSPSMSSSCLTKEAVTTRSSKNAKSASGVCMIAADVDRISQHTDAATIEPKVQQTGAHAGGVDLSGPEARGGLKYEREVGGLCRHTSGNASRTLRESAKFGVFGISALVVRLEPPLPPPRSAATAVRSN